MALIRTFIAIKIPEDIRNRIADLLSSLKGSGGKITWVKPHNMHLTLKFLGETEESIVKGISERLEQVLLSYNQFEINLKNIGAFPNLKKPKVLWIGTEGDKNILINLARNIDEQMSEFGFEREKRKFSAHLTIARIRDNRGIDPLIKKLEKKKYFVPGTFTVKDILFIKSELTKHGPIYAVLKKIKIN